MDRKRIEPEERIAYSLQQEDEAEGNHLYRMEQELLELIRQGDVEQIRKNQEAQVFPEYPNLLNYNVKKNEEYMAVITIALVARAAVEGGVSTSESFRLSDIYLKKLAVMQDIPQIIELREACAVEMAELVRNRKRGGKAGYYVEECKKFVATNIFKKISVRDVAVALNLNAVYLEHVFKEEEKQTIGQYIQKEKIKCAKNLLIYSDRSIMEISDYLNFSSQSYFGSVFRSIVGESPRVYRDTHKISGF